MFTSLFRTWLPEPYLGLPKKMFKSLHPSFLAWRPHQALFLLLSLSPVLSQCEKSPGLGVHAWSGLETSQLSFLGLYVLHRENGSHITSPAYITGHFRIEQSKYRDPSFPVNKASLHFMEMDRGTMLEFPNSNMLALLSPHCGINIIF